MPALVFNKVGERFFELGVRKGVLYPQSSTGTYPKGVAWNGLISIKESPDGAEANDLYADDMKYTSLRSAEIFGGTIESYQYPEEFEECDGTASPVEGVKIGQQKRKAFGLCYRTTVGNDVDSESDYKLHLVYGATASPSEKSYETVNDSPDAITFSWDFNTTPVDVTGYKPTATLVIDSRKVDPSKLEALEKKLYGDATNEATLPLPNEVIAMFQD